MLLDQVSVEHKFLAMYACSVRILPHRQNTAGLFLAVLTRTETLEDCWKREQEQYQAWLKGSDINHTNLLKYNCFWPLLHLRLSGC